MANPQIIVEYIANTAKLVDSVKQVTKGGEDANKSLSKINVKSIAKWSGAAIAIGAGVKFMKGATDATEALAKQSMALSRTTGMDTKIASEWVTVLKSRGIATDTFQVSIVKLSKSMEKSRTAQEKSAAAQQNYIDTEKALAGELAKTGKAHADAVKELNKAGDAADRAATAAAHANEPFAALGVRMQDIKKGNTQKVILEMADGLKKLKNPAQQAALSSQLLGRQSLKLAPILYKGSAAIQEQLDVAKKYGATVGDKTAKQVAQLAQDQREMNIAMEGVQVQVGTALMPVMLSLSKVLVSVTQVMQPLLTNATLMKVAIGLMVVAFVAYKAAVIASTIANLGLDAAMLPQIVTIGAIVIAIGALIAIAILVVKHWDDLTAAVSGAFDKVKQAAVTVIDWIKTNWPLLLAVITGPFGLAVLEIQKHWDAITGAARTAFNAVKGVFTGIAGALSGALSGAVGAAGGLISGLGSRIVAGLGAITAVGAKIGQALRSGIMAALKGVGHVLAELFKSAINAVLSLWNDLKIPGFKIHGPGPLPDISFPDINFPNITPLAKGGMVTRPTLALLGEAGPELVTPMSGGGMPISVRVFIGDTELRGLVRAEVVESNTRVARSLLAGGALMTMTLSVEPDVKNVRIDITAAAGPLTITRTGPSGVPADVRGYSGTTVSAGALIIRDFEAPIGVPLTYHASSGETGTITIPSDGCSDTWLTDLVRAGNTQLVVLENLAQYEYDVPSTSHWIIGRRAPIVSGDVAHTPAFELNFLTDTDEDREQARACLGNGVPVLLRTPPEDGIGNLYFSVAKFVEQRIVQQATQPARRFVVTATQVERPDPSLWVPLGPSTYAHVKATFATYALLKAGRATYDAVLYDWTGSGPSDIVPWPPDDV